MDFIKSDISFLDIELEIMNSQPDHNLFSNENAFLTKEDLLKDHDESENVKKERYIIKYKNKYIGIVDFTMKNPNDQKPWLGLFIIHKDSEGKGFAQKAYEIYEKMMIGRNVSEIRLGCFKNNVRGLTFWKKQNFIEIREVDYQNNKMIVMEKMLR